MKAIVLCGVMLVSVQLNAQYVLRVQKQVLYDVLNARKLETIVYRKDSLISSLRTSVSDLAKTVSSCQTYNTDYLKQISYLKDLNFKDQEQIIILNKEKKRLKRGNKILKLGIIAAIIEAVHQSVKNSL